MNAQIIREYRRLRSIGHNASSALRAARTKVAFREAESQGLVQLYIDADCETYDDSYLDTWGLSEQALAKARKELREQVSRDGVHIVLGQWRLSTDDAWESTDSCGGFIGDDWKDSGYDTDIMRTTLDALHEAQLRQRAAEYTPESVTAEGWAS